MSCGLCDASKRCAPCRLGTKAVAHLAKLRTGDPSPENSVCAERSEATSKADVISQILDAAFSPAFAAQLQEMIVEIADEVRVRERDRIATWLRTRADEAKKDRDDAEISVYVPPTLENVADRIEREEYRQ